MSDTKTFAANLKRLRHEAGLTQFELSEQCDVSYESIQRYEQGKQLPRRHVAIKLATMFGLTIEQLKGEKMEPV